MRKLLLVICCLGACKSTAEGNEPAPAPAEDGNNEAPAPGDDGKDEAPAPNDDTKADAPVDEIVYHFQDSSVPPEYHRSVTITAKPGSILRVVDSYGDEIERQEQTLDDEQFGALVEAFRKAGLKSKGEGVGLAGCTGGTGESLKVSNAGTAVFSGNVEHCGGSDAANFEGDLASVKAALEAAAKGNAKVNGG